MKTTDQRKATVVCYGEVLWDIFPTKTKPGGAPMNVAYHLRKLGADSRMISRVGHDEAGDKLLKLLAEWDIPTENCQTDEIYETGKVLATVLPGNEMSYSIHLPVAWDYIMTEAGYDSLVSEADAFVFGSLVTRNKTARETLYQLIDKAKFNVFDVNLRQPFYSQEIIEYLLGKCNLLKLNESELELIITWFFNEKHEEKSGVRFLQQKFNIDEVVVTKGAEGASYYTANESYSFPAFEVKVKDTCGSGDSFLAAFLSKKLEGESPETCMIYATGLGAFVASHEGACPAYDIAKLESYIFQKQTS
jgi:Sugar kinases, ribokinase family